MEFFYPNWINDFWRIMGIVHFDDKTYFEVAGEKRFCERRVREFAAEQGMAFFDTARKVCRLKDNASDNFLEILEPSDVGAMLSQLPLCTRVITTGGKAAEELASMFQMTEIPSIGSFLEVRVADGRKIEWWRMPSSSRAYPLAIDKKAGFYRRLFL